MSETIEKIRPVWTTGLTSALNTGTWRVSLPYYQNNLSPCTNNCPLHNQTPAWTQLIKNKQYHQAWLTIIDQNPFPAVTGRICHHPCEKACNRKHYDDEVAVQNLELFLGDLAVKENWPLPSSVKIKTDKVAIVGGGPAGLAAAYFLKREGFQVTIFEQKPKLGGLLQYGIPQYRLPKEILDMEIARLIATGIEVKTNTTISPDSLVELEKEFQAVFLALGAQKPKMLPHLKDIDQIFQGLDFLAKVNEGKVPSIGREIVVIGGGSSAIDVARSTRRLGKNVSIMALENKEQMPAQVEEVEETLEEGITLLNSSMVEKVVVKENGQLQITCCKVTLDPNVPNGIIKPISIPGTTYDIVADNVIMAIGQDPDLSGFSLEVSNNCISINQKNQTSREKIFAGGDATSLNRFVSVALSNGKSAAQSITNYLSTETTVEMKDLKEVVFEDINTFYFQRLDKLTNETVKPAERINSFSETKLSINTNQALTEAERCFNCGYCIECNNCYYLCPDMAVEKEKNNLSQKYRILEQYCKGCGLCAKECPRGVLVLKEESR